MNRSVAPNIAAFTMNLAGRPERSLAVTGRTRGWLGRATCDQHDEEQAQCHDQSSHAIPPFPGSTTPLCDHSIR